MTAKIKLHRAALLVVATLALFLAATAARAQDAALDTIVNTYQASSRTWLDQVTPLALGTFKAFITLESTWTLISLGLKHFSGSATLPAIIAVLIRKTIFLGLALAGIYYYNVAIPPIIKTFQDAGLRTLPYVSGFSPSTIVAQGTYLSWTLAASAQNAGFLQAPVLALATVFCSIVIFVCFLCIAWKIVAILLEVTVLLTGGFWALGFTASRFTVALAENYFVSLIRVGFDLFFLQFMVAVGSGLVPAWRAQLEQPINSFDGLLPVFTACGALIIYTAAAIRLPTKLALQLTAPSSFLHFREGLLGGE
jgi:P-type conjugative transfer protein TrbL